MRQKTGIRSLLLLLVAVAILPGLVMLWLGYTSTSQEAVQRGRQEIKTVGELAAANQEQLIEGVRQILATVAAGPSVRRNDLRPLCFEFLRNVAAATPGYGNIGVADLQGNIQCVANQGQQPVNVADRAYFRNAVRDQRFSVGEYLVGRITGKRQLGFGMPVFDYANVLVGVAFTTVELEPAAQKLMSLPLPGSIQVDITDSKGTLLASSRAGLERIGTTIDHAGLRAAIAAGTTSSLDVRDAQGMDWLYEFIAIENLGGERLFIITGGKRSDVLAPATRQLRQQLAAMAHAYVHFALHQPQLFRLMFSAELDHGRDPELAAAAEAAYASLAVAAAREDPASPAEVAVTCWAFVHGLAMLLLDRQILGVSDSNADTLVHALTQRFIAGLRSGRRA